MSQSTNVCKKVGGFLGFLAGLGGRCERTVGPDLCVESTHAGRTEALLQLQEERNALNPNVTVSEDEPIINSANTRVQKLISRLMTQVDLASDAFILYSIIAVAIGVPLVVCKREKGSRVIGATFGLRKMWFILLFVGMIALYDTVLAVYRETDFGRLYKNFVKDPCYVDPAFSSMRTALIVDACNNISYINLQSDRALQKMDTLYYDTRLFGFCKDDDRPLAVHPKLDEMDELRTAYREKRISNPGVCNATELNQITSTAPDAEDGSKWKALLGSGVLAQLLLKFVLTSWLVHLIAYIEPMVMHDGKVELWGAESSAELLESEQDALRRFARDKHLLSLVIFSIFMIFEIVLIGYSTWSSLHTVEQLDIVPEISAEPLPELLCPPFLL